jgi:hypothetical protein
MPYQGKLIGLLEMLDVLTSHERTEAAAVLELENAIEDKAIGLRLPDGTNADGETLYCEMSRAGCAEVVAVLRDFPNRMRIPLTRHGNVAAMFTAARCPRVQFETICKLVEHKQPDVPKTAAKGPAPGTINRFGESDRAKFPEIEILLESGKSLSAACDELGPSLEGPATDASKAKRLRVLFKKLKAAN